MEAAVISLLIEAGAAEAIGAGIASGLGAGTISAAAATAIGVGTVSAGMTFGQGGNLAQVLKSAVVGGVSSYAGSAIAQSVAGSVANSALQAGADKTVANAMGRVLGGAAAGAIRSGTSALFTAQDPIDAMLKGGITSALAAGIGVSVDEATKNVPGFGEPANAIEAAAQRAAKAALSSTIAAGGDISQIGPSVLGAFMSGLTKAEIKDESQQVKSANNAYQAALSEYDSNIGEQSALVNKYNAAIEPLNTEYKAIMGLKAQYDDAAFGARDWAGWAQANGYRATEDEYGNWSGNFVKDDPNAKFHYQNNQRWVDDGQGGSNLEYFQEKVWDTNPYIFAPTQAQLAAEANRIGNELNPRIAQYTTNHRNLLGGTYTETETTYLTNPETGQEYTYLDESTNEYRRIPSGEREVTRTVEGSLKPVTDRLSALKAAVPTLESKIVTKDSELENAIANFNTAEQQNAERVSPVLDNLVTARDLYKKEFGSDPTRDKLQSYVDSGDIIGAVTREVTDHSNERTAKEAGFSNYADYKSAGNLSSNDYYAKQNGWTDYATQLAATSQGFDSSSEWNTHLTNEKTAKDAGFNNYSDYESAGDTPSTDYYAQQSGWQNAAQKAEATNLGFTTPTTWSTYQTEQANATAAANAGFKSYADMQSADGDNANDYYAKQAGWADYSQKLFAIENGFGDDPVKYGNEIKAVNAGFPDYNNYKKYNGDIDAYKEEQAVISGFKNAADQQAANNAAPNDFYAQQTGFTDFNEQLFSIQNGFGNDPIAFRKQLKEATGFPDYQSFVDFHGDIAAYNAAQTPVAEPPPKNIVIEGENGQQLELGPQGEVATVSQPPTEIPPELLAPIAQADQVVSGPQPRLLPVDVDTADFTDKSVITDAPIEDLFRIINTPTVDATPDLTASITSAAEAAGFDKNETQDLIDTAPQIISEFYGQEIEPVGPNVGPNIGPNLPGLEPIEPSEFIPVTEEPGPMLPREPVVTVGEETSQPPVVERDVIQPSLDLNSISEAAREAGYSEPEMQDLLKDLGEVVPEVKPEAPPEVPVEGIQEPVVLQPIELSTPPVDNNLNNLLVNAAQEADLSQDDIDEIILKDLVEPVAPEQPVERIDVAGGYEEEPPDLSLLGPEPTPEVPYTPGEDAQDFVQPETLYTPGEDAQEFIPPYTPGEDSQEFTPPYTPGEDAQEFTPPYTPGEDAQEFTPPYTPGEDAADFQQPAQPEATWPNWIKSLFNSMLSRGSTPDAAKSFVQNFLGSGTGDQTGIQSPGMLGPTAQPWYSQMPEFDITKTFSPTLYAMRKEEPEDQAEEE